MSDDQVKSFIDRYIPGYVFFLEGVQRGWDPNYIRNRHMNARSHCPRHHHGEGESDGDGGDATAGNITKEGTEGEAQHPSTPTPAHISASTISLSHADEAVDARYDVSSNSNITDRTRTRTRSNDKTETNPPWKGRGLCIHLDQRRAVIGFEKF